VGLRVADYPTIQDYVGEALMDTNALACSCSRSRRRWTARPTATPGTRAGALARGNYLHWAWQIKFEAAKNVAHVVDKMLHACGGSGYKRDMELERYLRDAKAGWVMGPTNEVLRQFVGKAVLLGFESLDYWNQSYNRRAGRERGEEARRRRQARARRAADVRGGGAGAEGTGEEGLGDGGRQRPVEAPRRRVPRGRPVLRAVLGASGWRDGAGDRAGRPFTVIDVDGGQVAEVTMLAPDGTNAAAAIGARAEAPATVVRALVSSMIDGAREVVQDLAAAGSGPEPRDGGPALREWSRAGLRAVVPGRAGGRAHRGRTGRPSRRRRPSAE
jgi:hypothetical protein